MTTALAKTTFRLPVQTIIDREQTTTVASLVPRSLNPQYAFPSQETAGVTSLARALTRSKREKEAKTGEESKKPRVSQRTKKRPPQVSTERLDHEWKKRSRPTNKELRDKTELVNYNRTFLGIDSAKVDPTNGESSLSTDTEVFRGLQRFFGTTDPPPPPEWHSSLLTRAALHRGPMGRPSC